MSGFMWKMAGALVVAVIGMSMLFWALERASLVAFAGQGTAGTARAPMHVYLLMFAGLVLVYFAGFYAVLRWSRYLRENPDTQQLPLWFLTLIGIFGAGSLLTAIAIHAGWVRQQHPVPSAVNEGFVLFQVVMGALVLIPLVLVGVRWAPGYKHRVSEA